MAYLKSLLSKISGLGGGGGKGDCGDERDFLPDTLLKHLRIRSDGDASTPTSSHLPEGTFSGDRRRIGSSLGDERYQVPGGVSFLPGFFRNLDPGSQPFLSQRSTEIPQGYCETGDILSGRRTLPFLDDEDDLIPEEIPMLERVKAELEKARASHVNFRSHYEFCVKIYPKEFHAFLVRQAKKDSRVWLWKGETGRRARKVMRKRGILPEEREPQVQTS